MEVDGTQEADKLGSAKTLLEKGLSSDESSVRLRQASGEPPWSSGVWKRLRGKSRVRRSQVHARLDNAKVQKSQVDEELARLKPGVAELGWDCSNWVIILLRHAVGSG